MTLVDDAASDVANPGHPREVRLTGLARSAAGGGGLLETVEQALATLNPDRAFETQMARHTDDDDVLVLHVLNVRLFFWCDRDGTAWIVGVDDQASNHRPTDLDRWLRKRQWIADWLAHVRVVGPLLLKRAFETERPSRVEFDEGALGIAHAPEALHVEVTAPAFCSTGEALRVASIAALSVSTSPGWHRIDSSQDTHEHAFILMRELTA